MIVQLKVRVYMYKKNSFKVFFPNEKHHVRKLQTVSKQEIKYCTFIRVQQHYKRLEQNQHYTPKTHMHNTKQNQGFCKEFRVEVGLLGLCCKEKEERGRIKSELKHLSSK